LFHNFRQSSLMHRENCIRFTVLDFDYALQLKQLTKEGAVIEELMKDARDQANKAVLELELTFENKNEMFYCYEKVAEISDTLAALFEERVQSRPPEKGGSHRMLSLD